MDDSTVQSSIVSPLVMKADLCVHSENLMISGRIEINWFA